MKSAKSMASGFSTNTLTLTCWTLMQLLLLQSDRTWPRSAGHGSYKPLRPPTGLLRYVDAPLPACTAARPVRARGTDTARTCRRRRDRKTAAYRKSDCEIH